MSGTLIIKRAHAVPADVKLMRQITKALLEELLDLKSYELGVHLVRAPEMARINEAFLNHEGPTDVITFDYAEISGQASSLHGELFLCYEVARTQAREFRTTWPEELVRYVVHGVLHLQGFDDHAPADRRKMKRAENRLLRKLVRRFPISKLAQTRRPA